MATYALGDVQGCLAALEALLARIEFDPKYDTLWFTGDLVNRGPHSLGVLRFVRSLGDRAISVLGNHDLHLLAVAAGASKHKSSDTFDDVLRAPDRAELLTWLGRRPLLHRDDDLGYTLVHAGLLPQWTTQQAAALAAEAQAALASAEGESFFHHMYGDLPDHWHDGLHGIERLRVIINAFTRLRYCDREGNMDLRHKGPPGTQPPDLLPWFTVPARRSTDTCVVFGHWSTLGLHNANGVIGLDTGCLWGRSLTAVRLDSERPEFVSVDCIDAQRPG
ncbi:MAG: symmetrical bis(5'-nucleosyl)-tetraphosphatase [Pseudomonadota bacterium]|nr:MAG: symmetrical bis(5'-nucleosyl)-tetraphosphatase [Pseudomonadota bacterium]